MERDWQIARNTRVVVARAAGAGGLVEAAEDSLAGGLLDFAAEFVGDLLAKLWRSKTKRAPCWRWTQQDRIPRREPRVRSRRGANCLRRCSRWFRAQVDPSGKAKECYKPVNEAENAEVVPRRSFAHCGRNESCGPTQYVDDIMCSVDVEYAEQVPIACDARSKSENSND